MSEEGLPIPRFDGSRVFLDEQGQIWFVEEEKEKEDGQ